ncbi:MAG TPA: hypothetical protein VMS87_07930 [Roseiarcus sp.]|nr:hypothetical protein [Roseiarcus sp.]
MISVFQVDVAEGDEAALDDILENKLADVVSTRVDRFGRLETVHVLKGDVEGASNTYIIIAGISGLGLSFERAFKTEAFPASLKVTALAGAYHQVAKWPDTAPELDR